MGLAPASVERSGVTIVSPDRATAVLVGSTPGGKRPTSIPTVDPLERSAAAVEKAQAVAAQTLSQAAARAALQAKQQETLRRYEQLRAAGEARTTAAQQELLAAQDELRQTTAALDSAQAMLSDRTTKLNEARGKLATLMSMTRDLLRLVRPVAEMRDSAHAAAEAARGQLAHLTSSVPAPAVSPPSESLDTLYERAAALAQPATAATGATATTPMTRTHAAPAVVTSATPSSLPTDLAHLEQRLAAVMSQHGVRP